MHKQFNNFWYSQEVPIFLPDIGTFFNQDAELAKSIVKACAEAGLETIKGEILHSSDICLNTNLNEKYLGVSSGKLITENYKALIERKVVPLNTYQEIFTYAQSLGLDVIVSVYDDVGAKFAKDIGCIAIKIASSNVTHQPLIEYVARLNLPIILDTGKSTLEEIVRAVNWAQDAGNNDILIEHSPPAPPAEVSEHNLNFMTTIAKATGLAVGLSDHHHGNEMLLAATAMGAVVLEKGVCLNHKKDEQDSFHAICVKDLKTVNDQIKMIHSALGNGQRYFPRERDKNPARMGLIAKSTINAQEHLNTENVTFAFPALGISTEYWGEVVTKVASKTIPAGTAITWDMLG